MYVIDDKGGIRAVPSNYVLRAGERVIREPELSTLLEARAAANPIFGE